VVSLEAMFSHATAFTGVGLERWNVLPTKSTLCMLYGTAVKESDAPSWCVDCFAPCVFE
jgi:hypothetical protein